MRIKKKHIQEKVDPNAVANQAGEVVDAVANELDSDEETAKSFVKSMAISENAHADHVVEFAGERSGENPFVINGIKWQYVNAIYPDGKKDIGVYRYGHDITYAYDWFHEEMIPKPNIRGITEDGEGAASRAIQHGIKPDPEVSQADKKALKIGEPKAKINYGEKDLPFESEIKESTPKRTIIKTIKIKDLK